MLVLEGLFDVRDVMSRVLDWDVDSLALSELSDEAEKQDLQFDPDTCQANRG